MSNLVFVFGTLKEGFPNFGSNAGQRVPGDFETMEARPLYLVGERNSPWLVNTPGIGLRVKGQVFRVDANALSQMDVLERVVEADGYERAVISVRSLLDDSKGAQSVYVYLKHERHLKGAKIQAGPLSEYRLDHAILYRRRTDDVSGGQLEPRSPA